MASNTLLLQGPVGPFFKRLARDLKESGQTVYKINLNAGDRFFFSGENSVDYIGTVEQWPGFLKQFLEDCKITTIYLFGDERSYHKRAHEVARLLSIDVFVFEEGYLRPHYVTLEKDGVNGRSSIPRTPEAYQDVQEEALRQPASVPYSFAHAGWYAAVYFFMGWLGQSHFPDYIHHRPFKWYNEAVIWVRGGFRKYYYRFCERGVQQQLTTHYSKRFFLVPLQVHNDTQIKIWSSVPSAAAFIRRVISSFSKHAPTDTLLVIKHHPLDRGYSDYTRIIHKLADKYGCKARVIYVHDMHLPTLLDHAKGTVLLNSTVGLSSIFHGTPVKTSGHAIYNMAGLTFQGEMKAFWKTQGKVDRKLYQRFRNHLIEKNQINGNFYRKTPGLKSHSGIDYQHLVELTQASDEATHSTATVMPVASPGADAHTLLAAYIDSVQKGIEHSDVA